MTRRYRRRRHGRMSGGETAAAAVVAGLVLAAAAHSAGSGNVPAALTAAKPPTAAAAVAIAYAKNQLGKPYCWGGTGSACYDCSGLVMEAYASAGVSIPRTSEAQWAGLPHIAASQLKPGDLIFYAGSDGTVSSPGHVVMYLGGGSVIQAYATGYPIMTSALASMNAGGLTGYARP
jgi:cell wall-associated NlpC family hydrolase